MRLAMAGRYYNRQGGVSRVLAELADRAAAAGHDVDVYTHEALDVDPASRVRFVEVEMRRRPVWRETQSFARHVGSVLDPAAYDVVHSHDGQARHANVITAHSCYAAWLHDVRHNAGIKGLASRVYPRHVSTERWEQGTYRDPDPLVIAISRVVASELERFHGVAPERVRVVHNGVDVDGFRPPASREAARAALPPAERPADEGMVFLFVGMYFRRKGLQTLLRALAGLRDDPWTLMVVGGDDEEPFRAIAQEGGIADRVRFLGHRPQVTPYMQAADAFVFPTEYEPFGLVISEALACGTPVITSARAGGAELMVDGRDGLLLEDPASADELRGALRRFAALDGEQRAAMSAAARLSAVDTSWDAQWRRHEDLFTQVAVNRRAGRPAWAS